MKYEVVRLENGYDLVSNIEKCIAKGKAFSVTTRGELDYWLLDKLATNNFNDVHLCLNTLDDEKWYQFNNGMCSNPMDLVYSVIDCFNNGIYVFLQVEIVNGLISKKDVFEVINTVKNWVQTIELKFDGFSDDDKEEYKELICKFVDDTKAKIVEIGD